MKTAASDVVIVRIVKPISFDPLSAASSGASPASMWRTMFSSITIASSTTKPMREDERHHRQVVEAVVQQLHDGERAENRERQRERRNERRRAVVQEEIDDADHQHERDDHRDLDVAERRADRHRAILPDAQVHRRRQLRLERRQHRADGVGDLDDVGARLLLHLQRDRALPAVLRVEPRAPASSSRRCRRRWRPGRAGPAARSRYARTIGRNISALREQPLGTRAAGRSR